MISGRESPEMSARAGVSTIGPCWSEGPASALNVTLWVAGSTDVDLGLVHHKHRESVHRRAVVVEGVDMAVEPRGDQLELAVVVPVEVGEDGRAEEAALRAVAVALAHVLERRERLTRVLAHGLRFEDEAPVRLPAVDLPFEVGRIDLRDRRRGSYRRRRRRR